MKMAWNNGWRERAIAQIEFKCDRCGRCCVKPEIIDVKVRDVWRLARRFHVKFNSALEQYVVPHKLDDRRMMFKHSQPCVFYDDGCRIYKDRPIVCRMAPFLAAIVPNHIIELISDQEYTDDEIFEGIMRVTGLGRPDVVGWLEYIGAWVEKDA